MRFWEARYRVKPVMPENAVQACKDMDSEFIMAV